MPREAFDIFKQRQFFLHHERHGLTGSACAPSATDAMHVIFRHIRQFVIHHIRQLIDVDAARRDVGRDQHLQRASFKFAQRFHARALALVAVNGHRRDARFFELLSKAISAVFGTRKDERLRPVTRFHKVNEELGFVRFIHAYHRLLDHLNRGVATCHFNHLRVIEQTIGEGLDLVRERGAEQQILALWR